MSDIDFAPPIEKLPNFRKNGCGYGIRYGREWGPDNHHYLVHCYRHLRLDGDSSSWKIVRILSYVYHNPEFNKES